MIAVLNVLIAKLRNTVLVQVDSSSDQWQQDMQVQLSLLSSRSV